MLWPAPVLLEAAAFDLGLNGACVPEAPDLPVAPDLLGAAFDFFEPAGWLEVALPLAKAASYPSPVYAYKTYNLDNFLWPVGSY